MIGFAHVTDIESLEPAAPAPGEPRPSWPSPGTCWSSGARIATPDDLAGVVRAAIEETG